MSYSDSDESDSGKSSYSESDAGDASDVTSVRSLAFSVKPGTGTATVKNKKTKKRVRFKAGDSLVLVYIIPNREMLGLKSDSEESGESDEDSDDEDDDGEDDDDCDDEEEEDEDEDDEDEDGTMHKKVKQKKEKTFAKLLTVKHVTRRSPPDLRNNVKKARDGRKALTFDLSVPPPRLLNKRNHVKPNKKEKKANKKEVLKTTPVQLKQSRGRRNNSNKPGTIKVDIDKERKTRRKKSSARFLEIRATIEPAPPRNKSVQDSRNDLKPALIDVNESIVACSKPLVNRTRLQPTCVHISKSRPNAKTNPVTSKFTSTPEKQASVAQVVSASYDSLSSVLPDSYITIQSLKDDAVSEETITRLDPDLMNAKSKRNYAWQIANGTITSQSLRTPCILPFWDSIQNSVSENNTLKLPT